MAGVQGHIRYHFALDDVAQRTPIIFQQGNCAAADFYGLANAANLKRGLNVRDLVDFHDDAFHNELLESQGERSRDVRLHNCAQNTARVQA